MRSGPHSHPKVLHVIASTDPRTGGPIEVVNTLCDVWARHGFGSGVVSLDKPEANWLPDVGGRVTALGVGGTVVSKLPARGYSFSPRLAPWLRRHAPEYGAVIVHGLWNYASVGTWQALRGSAVPYFVFVHGMLDPWFLRAYPVRAKAKALFWHALERRVVEGAAGLLFTTEEERRLAAQSFQPYDVREAVVGLGARDIRVEPGRARAAFLTRVPEVRDRNFSLFLGRVHPKKGLDVLFRAYAQQAPRLDLDLVVAGPDQVGLRPPLEALARDLGIASRVHWAGMLTGDAKSGAFQCARYFVLPSHQENFGIAVTEALACGTPVLITDKVNIWPSIAASAAGVVVDDTVEGIADGLRRFGNLSENELNAMAERARCCFLEHFELERVSLNLLNVILPRGGPMIALPSNAKG